MLAQTFRRRVPERDAFIERTILRERRFCLAIVRSRLIALDRGVIAHAVKFPQRSQRPQLSIVLGGSGYLDVEDREIELRAGEFAVCDQRLLRGEGYGGPGCEVVILDWAPMCPLTSPLDTTHGRLDARDLSWLREHVASLTCTPRESWLEAFAARLEAMGITEGVSPFEAPREDTSAALVELYGAMGALLSRLETQPTLTDLAALIGTGERQTKRRLVELAHAYGHAFDGFRDFIHETRLDWATQLLSVPDLTLSRVASLAGYRSTVALHHAFSTRGADTPREISQRLAKRWGRVSVARQ